MKKPINKHANDDECQLSELRAYLDRPDYGAASGDGDERQFFAPFSYAGGKRLNVVPVWQRLGIDVPNYIEPFSGGGAIFFGRPPNRSGKRRRELLNDECCLLGNVYRALKYADPAQMAAISAEIYTEVDLIAWNREIIRNRFALRGKMLGDVRYYDLELAARWIWLQRGWIGGGAFDARLNINAKMPRSRIAGWQGVSATELYAWLKQRLATTQLFCGDFERAIASDTQTRKFSATAVLFDPPYSPDFCSRSYLHQARTTAWRAFEIALRMGACARLRICYCGYGRIFGARFAAAGWEAVKCRSLGGFGNQAAPGGRGRQNSADEYIWFSPYCLKA